MASKAAKFSTDLFAEGADACCSAGFARCAANLLGEHKIVAMDGWKTKIHGSLHWQPMNDDTRWLQYLIEDSIEQKIVTPGESDFIFEVPAKRLEVMFCHESDIHLDGTDDQLLQQFMTSEPYLQMHWQTQADVQKSMSKDA
jgi:hypothetical protein